MHLTALQFIVALDQSAVCKLLLKTLNFPYTHTEHCSVNALKCRLKLTNKRQLVIVVALLSSCLS